MKAVFTQFSMDGLYRAREAVGGAGFSCWSGLPYLIDDFAPCVTFEGDNTVMCQQSAKYVTKQYKLAKEGTKVGGFFEYMNDIHTYKGKKMAAKTPEELADHEAVIEAFSICSLSLIEKACEKINSSKAHKKEKQNFLFANDLVKMAQCHIKLTVVLIMAKRLKLAVCPRQQYHLKN